MKTGLSAMHHRLALAVATAGLLAVSALAAPHVGKQTATSAQELFSDAPIGVDPIVTGPRTAAFRERQEFLHCDAARWPDVPVGCYPG